MLVTRVFTLALGKEPFAGPAVPGGLCREFPLSTGCAESNSLSAKPWIPVVVIVCIVRWGGPRDKNGWDIICISFD
jgi:hypothetical protein